MAAVFDNARLFAARDADRPKRADVAAFVLRRAENLTATTGYWPVAGLSAAVITPSAPARPALVLPRREQEFVPAGFPGEVVIFEPEYVPDGEGELARLVRQLCPPGPLACDAAVGQVAATNTAGEIRLPAEGWLRAILPADGRGYDATDVLARLRSLKTPGQVALIRRAQRFALRGLGQALDMHLKPGIKEIALAARIEAEIEEQLGEEGSQRVRAFCFVQAGPNSALAGDTISISGSYRLQAGDLVVIELGVVVDGYWADITRTVSVGDSPQQHLVEAVRTAQAAALAVMRPGLPVVQADAAARNALGELERYFHHALGHGVGLAYHEPPFMHRRSEAVLEAGMVVTVEPGVYIADQAGARWEDNVLITSEGIEILSV